MTSKGNFIFRTQHGNGFVVRQQIISYDTAANECYQAEQDHATMYLPIGISKSDAWRMLSAWLSFYDDEELNAKAWEVLCELYQPAKPMLPMSVPDDDKDLN